MKLLLCRDCGNILRLDSVADTCPCGKSGGFYTDGLNAEYWGDDVMPLGFHNASFKLALQNQPETGMGEVFEAFVIPKSCPTMKKIPDPYTEAKHD